LTRHACYCFVHVYAVICFCGSAYVQVFYCLLLADLFVHVYELEFLQRFS